MAAGGDRSSLRLRGDDEALIARVAELSERVVVVMQCGSAVVTPWAESVPAVLYGWYAGVEGGSALAAVLAGDAEPGGRLPFAVPVEESQLVPFDRDAVSATYDLFHGQWQLDRDSVTAHFPFGWGLGYTTFELGDVHLGVDQSVLDVAVTNTGPRSGSTVVFVHAGLPGSSVERPVQRLVGFVRVRLDAGASVSVSVPIDWPQLDVRRSGTWWTEPGRYRLWVGAHAGDPAATVVDVERTGDR